LREKEDSEQIMGILLSWDGTAVEFVLLFEVSACLLLNQSHTGRVARGDKVQGKGERFPGDLGISQIGSDLYMGVGGGQDDAEGGK
jgi:hypothetical protein